MKSLTSKKLIAFYLSFLISFFLLTSCSNDDDALIEPQTIENPESETEEETKSSENKIEAFSFLKTDNSQLFDDKIEAAIINHDSGEIIVNVPYKTDIEKLIPTIFVSNKASIDKEGLQNFKNKIIYKITAEDKSTTNYTVKINVLDITERDVLIAILKINPNNQLENAGLTGWNSKNISGIGTWLGVTLGIGETSGESSKIIKLNLIKMGITILPKEIGFLKDLVELQINQNNSSLPSLEFPEEISELSILKTLNISGCQINAFPKAILKLSNLETLNINTNKVISIPSEINKLTKLRHLNLAFNNLKNVPSSISNLKFLESLLLVSNNISSIPQVICDMETNGLELLKDDNVNCN